MRQAAKGRRTDNSSPEQPPTHERFKVLVVCCFLLAAVLAVYNPITEHDFLNCDDDAYIYMNRHVSEGLSWENVKWSFTSAAAGNWHPLTWLSHALDAQMYGIHPGMDLWKGPEAGGHHFTNVLLHAAAAIALFLALRRMTDALWCSAFVAAMFALHPLRVESVAWAAERKDVLSGLFWMLTLLAYAGYASRPSVGRYLAVLGLFALGLMSKSMLVTLPCVLLLLDFWPLGRWQPGRFCKHDSPRGRLAGQGSHEACTTGETPSRFAPRSLGWLVLEKIPLLALSAAVCVIVAATQRAGGAMSTIAHSPLDVRIANAAISAVAYLWMTIWPVNLAIFYPHPAALASYSVDRLMWQGVAAAAVLLAITLLVIWNLRRRPYLAVGWFWYLGVLAPVIGLVQVGSQARADRYTYLPMIGVSIMLAWGVAELAARSNRVRAAVGVVAAALLGVWIVLTARQVPYWKDSTSVFEHAIKATRDNYFAHNHLGLTYLRDGDKERAGAEFAKALKIAPSYDAANANLGAYYASHKQYDKAVDCLEAAVRANPFKVPTRANLGAVYTNLGRLDEATAELRRAIELSPGYVQSHLNLAQALCRQGDIAGMLAEWREVIRLSPGSVEVRTSAARLLATCPEASLRSGREAVELGEQAVELTKDEDPSALDALAAAQAETGQFRLAAETATRAEALAARQEKPALAKSIRARISLYKDDKPYREPPPAFEECPLAP
jgi:protein O-mannosyl-transferase